MLARCQVPDPDRMVMTRAVKAAVSECSDVAPAACACIIDCGKRPARACIIDCGKRPARAAGVSPADWSHLRNRAASAMLRQVRQPGGAGHPGQLRAEVAAADIEGSWSWVLRVKAPATRPYDTRRHPGGSAGGPLPFSG